MHIQTSIVRAQQEFNPGVAVAWKRFCVLFGLAEIILEFNSIDLLLWPVKHSCALPVNLNSSAFNLGDLKQKSISSDVIQTNLIDASPDDSLTAARAFSMGIHYDDISRCLEYPVEYNPLTGNSTINMESLETCKHGLHFEQQEFDISIVDIFQLACAREWMKILIPHAATTGILLGMCLIYLILHMSASDRSKTVMIAALRVIASLMICYCTGTLSSGFNGSPQLGHPALNQNKHPREGYNTLLCCFLLRSFLISGWLVEIFLTWKPLTNQTSDRVRERQENQIYLIGLFTVYIIFQATFYPLALHLFAKWTTLNGWLSIATLTYVFVAVVTEFIVIRNRSQESAESPTSYLDENCPDDLPRQKLTQEDELDGAGVGSTCEFCSARYPTGNSRVGSIEMTNFDSEDAYKPTTSRIFVELSGDRKLVGAHQSASMSPSFRKWTFRCQILLLSLGVSLNCFLLKMASNHRLMHSESLSSRTAWRHNYALRSGGFTADKTVVEIYTNLSSQERDSSKYLLEQTNHKQINTSPPQSLYHQAFGFAEQTIETMQFSDNPFELLWTTTLLTGWPIETLVLLIHVSKIVKFEQTYFKLDRVFSLVQFGANLMLVEWIVVALLRSRNHLIELQWLHAFAALVARLSSTFMLYNYLHTILKLSRKLVFQNFITFVPGSTSAILALVLANFAPFLEKVDLVIIPVILIVNNLAVSLLTKDLRCKLEQNLCPMLFGHM